MCGRADHYELVASDRRPRPGAFVKGNVVVLKDPKAPGEAETRPLTGPRRRFVGIRAVDEAGNLGRLAVARRR
jgi:hypothetical protein